MSLRDTARSFFGMTLARVDVASVMRRKIRYEEQALRVVDTVYALGGFRRIKIVSIGKAAAPMAETMVELIAPHLRNGQRLDGISVGTRLANAHGIRSFLGGHPLPDEQSALAARAVLAYLVSGGDGERETLVFFLISGGASAMLEQPLDGTVTQAETLDFYRALVHSGLNIETMNVLRKHFSAVKGGRLAVAAGTATQCTLLISDVPGEAFHIVGSGPTLPDPSTLADCGTILERHRKELPLSARIAGLLRGGFLPETPKRGDFAFARSSMAALLSSDDLALEAAELARLEGFHVVIDQACDEWPYEAAAEHLLRHIEALSRVHPKVCLVSAGEISVQIGERHGVGGRNQHFVLACAQRVAESGLKATVLSAGSDGIDGNSGAAGGIADETTVARAAAMGLSVAEALAGFDSNSVLEALGDTVVTGPSGNNVRDLRLLLIDGAAQGRPPA